MFTSCCAIQCYSPRHSSHHVESFTFIFMKIRGNGISIDRNRICIVIKYTKRGYHPLSNGKTRSIIFINSPSTYVIDVTLGYDGPRGSRWMMRPNNLTPRRRGDAIGHVSADGPPPTTIFAAAEILARRRLRTVIGRPLERPCPTLQGRQRHCALVGTFVACPSVRIASRSCWVDVLVRHRLLRGTIHLRSLVPRYSDSLRRIQTTVSFGERSIRKTSVSLINIEGRFAIRSCHAIFIGDYHWAVIFLCGSISSSVLVYETINWPSARIAWIKRTGTRIVDFTKRPDVPEDSSIVLRREYPGLFSVERIFVGQSPRSAPRVLIASQVLVVNFDIFHVFEFTVRLHSLGASRRHRHRWQSNPQGLGSA